MVLPLRFDWFQNLSTWAKVLTIAAAIWLAVIAWPVAMAMVFAVVVLGTLRDRKAALALISVLAIPTLAMEGLWLSTLVAGVVERQEDAVQTYSVASNPTSNEASNVSDEAVRGAQSQSAGPVVRVVSATSGDALEVTIDGKPDHVRLIGVNAPALDLDDEEASECFGVEAYMFLNSLLRNQIIDIEADLALGDKDENGYLLRYVEMTDGTDVNELMLMAGLGRGELDLEYREQANYSEKSFEAAKSNKGLWASCNDDGTAKTQAESNESGSRDTSTPGAVPSPTSQYIQPTAVPTVSPQD